MIKNQFIRLSRRPPIKALLMAAAFWIFCWCVPGAQAQDDPEPQAPGKDIFFMDTTHAFVSRSVDQAAKWFDHFFTPPREQIEAAYSYLIFKDIYTITEGEGGKNKPQMKIKIHLPGLERRASLVIEGGEQDKLATTPAELAANSDTDVPPEPNTTNRSVGIQYTAAKWVKSRVDFKVAIRSTWKPVASARYRKDIPISYEIKMRFTETGFWKYLDGFGETTRLDFLKQLNPLLLLQWSNFATYSELSSGLEWGSDLGLGIQISQKSALFSDIGVSGATRPLATIGGYHIGTRYRRNFFRPWLFYEVEPALDFPRDEQGVYKEVASINFRLEAQFRKWN